MEYAVAAIEIVNSRIAAWDIRLTDTIADNASSGLFVLAEHRLTLDEFEPRETIMRMYADDELVSEGDGAACLGDPLNAPAWLARTAQEYGEPLRADSYDNALAEAFNSLFKAELIRNRGPWTGINDVEVAVAEYIDWFNQRRLHGELGHITPAEHEAAHYLAAEAPASLQKAS